MNDNDPEFAEDLLRGAEAISQYLFGDTMQRRRVYHLVATSNLPVFKLGSMICARKTVIRGWVEQQEQKHTMLTSLSTTVRIRR